MARVYARAIYEGTRTLDTCPKKYRQAIIDAYWDIYGIHLEG